MIDGIQTKTKRGILKAPFPWMGGKSKVADLVWQRLGDVDNYIEPFVGSAAVLLRRPVEHFFGGYRVETVNDLNHHLVNFWRAVTNAPEEVARYANSPVFEADLHARHRWLVNGEHVPEWRCRVAEDPNHFDPKIAGWWVWGACCWIGSGWCDDRPNLKKQMPQMDHHHGVLVSGRPQLTDAHDIGRGVNASTHAKRPAIATGSGSGEHMGLGRGVHASPQSTQLAGHCDERLEWLIDWMKRLADRLRLVRTCYGHWDRICDSESTMTRLGLTGVFLDPPYPTERAYNGKKSRAAGIYATDNGSDLNQLRDEVLSWCIKWGRNPRVRVIACGYEGDGYEPLVKAHGWTVEHWVASGGYGNQSKRKCKAENAKRERLFISPNCIRGGGLFH